MHHIYHHLMHVCVENAQLASAHQVRIQGINKGRDCFACKQNLLINIHLFMKFIKIDGYLARASWQWNTVCVRAAPQFVRCLLSYSACACLCLQLLHAWVSVASASVLIGVATIIYFIHELIIYGTRGGEELTPYPPWIHACPCMNQT